MALKLLMVPPVPLMVQALLVHETSYGQSWLTRGSLVVCLLFPQGAVLVQYSTLIFFERYCMYCVGGSQCETGCKQNTYEFTCLIWISTKSAYLVITGFT